MIALDDRDDVLARHDLLQLWGDMGLAVRGRRGECPNPAHAQTGASPPVQITPSTGLWHCKGCGAGGTAIDLLVMVGQVADVAEAFTYLGARQPEERAHVDPRSLIAKPSFTELDPADEARLLAEYANQRGWRLDVARRCGLRAVEWNDGPRVFFPVRAGGRVLGGQGRALAGQLPKMKNPLGERLLVWAEDHVGALDLDQRETRALWVCEGPQDGVALAHLADEGLVAPVLAIPGATPGDRVLGDVAAAIASAKPDMVVIATDADPAGEQLRADLARRVVGGGRSVVHLRMPSGLGDLDDWRRTAGADDQRWEVELGDVLGEAEVECGEVAV